MSGLSADGYSFIKSWMSVSASANSSMNSLTTVRLDFTLSTNPTPWPTKYETSSRAFSLPLSAARCAAWRAGSLIRLCKGIGNGPGLSGPSQASVHAERSWREYLPVRHLDRTVSRDRASIIFWRKISEVSDSVVASHTDPVHTPAAPRIIHAAIWRPVMIPHAANTGTLR